MATRKISSACIAASSRHVSLSVRIARQPLRPVSRHLHTTSIRYEQKANTSAKRAPAPKIVRGESKLFKDADAAVADIQSGATILSAGFGLAGTADTLIAALKKRGASNLNDLTVVSNNGGTASGGGLSPLVEAGQISRLIMSFLGNNKALEKKYINGEIAIELCPQGTIAERIRAAGAGIPAFFTPTGINTLLQHGEIPVRMGPKDPATGKATVVEKGKKRETREFAGKTYGMEMALPGDVAILRAWKVDSAGNCQFRYTTKAFGQVMAKAAKVTIVEAENIVEVGDIHPDYVHLPGIYVNRIVPSFSKKEIEIRTLAPVEGAETKEKDEALLKRERIARRTAKELKNGYYVNLGVGIPTLAPSFLSKDIQVWIQSENGLLGMGPYPTEETIDADIINAGKETVTINAGGSTFDSSESFAMIRGGHIDVSVLGALQVSATGDLANYMIPGKVFKGMGGAMDLVGNPSKTKIVVATEHVARDGSAKIVQECALPLTGARVVSTIITDLCVFEVDREGAQGGLTLVELAPGVTVEEVREKTDARFEVAESLGEME